MTELKKVLNTKLNKKKGFTLAELLVVVAIIAVLVAISIPVFSGTLDKAQEATDAANLRAAYAEVKVAYLSDEKDSLSQTVSSVQSDKKWKSAPTIGDAGTAPDPGADGWTVAADANGKVTITKKDS